MSSVRRAAAFAQLFTHSATGRIEFCGIMFEVEGLANEFVCRSPGNRRVSEHVEILIILESFSDQLQADAFNRNLGFASYLARRSRIKQRAVTISTKPVNVLPGIMVVGIRFVHGEVQF